MLKSIVFIFFLLIGCTDKSTDKHPKLNYDLVNSNHNPDSIILKLREELEDEQVRINFSTLTNRMIDRLEKSKSDASVLFPYSKSDSIVLFDVSKEDRNYIETLSQEKANKLMELLNNPLYYHWAECGTPVPEYVFIFYLNEKNIAEVVISCNMRSIECLPENSLTRFGGTNRNGGLIMKSIITSH